MEPPGRQHIERILAERPEATPELIREFYRLAADRLNRNPNITPSDQELAARHIQDLRLLELREALFGPAPVSLEPGVGAPLADGLEPGGPTSG